MAEAPLGLAFYLKNEEDMSMSEKRVEDVYEIPDRKAHLVEELAELKKEREEALGVFKRYTDKVRAIVEAYGLDEFRMAEGEAIYFEIEDEIHKIYYSAWKSVLCFPYHVKKASEGEAQEFRRLQDEAI